MVSSSGAPVVVSFGGSVLFAEPPSARRLAAVAAALRRWGRRRPLVVTVGGGPTARRYIALGRDLGLTEVELDEIGIDLTRVHARILAGRLGPPTPPRVPTSVAEAVQELHRASPVVLGGTEPGHTTDGVAALIASRIRASRVVNATSVDGVYDRDPRRHRFARRMPALSWARFRAMVEAATSSSAGQTFPFDLLGIRTLERARIPLYVVGGGDLANLGNAIAGRPFRGSRVGEDADNPL